VLGAVDVLGDLYELGGAVVREPRILLGHAFDDVGLREPLVHQLAHALADSDDVRSALIGDAGRIGPSSYRSAPLSYSKSVTMFAAAVSGQTWLHG
jgi:hypothetical protein